MRLLFLIYLLTKHASHASSARAIAHEAKLDVVSFRFVNLASQRRNFVCFCTFRSHRSVQADTLLSVKKFNTSARSVASSLQSSKASAQLLLSSVRSLLFVILSCLFVC
jgi:hypothetical protein